MAINEMVDPEFVRSVLTAQRDSIGSPDASPPPKGVQIHGFDGTYARRVLVDSSGRLLLKL